MNSFSAINYCQVIIDGHIRFEVFIKCSDPRCNELTSLANFATPQEAEAFIAQVKKPNETDSPCFR